MHADSSTWFKPKIDKNKLKELSKRSDIPGLIHFAVYFLSLIIFGYLSFFLGNVVFFNIFFHLFYNLYICCG